jgi:hypothetical protein
VKSLLVLALALGAVEQVSLVPQPRVIQTLTSNSTTAGTPASVNPTTLWSYSLPANALDYDGKAIRVTAWGTVSATVGVKGAQIQFNNDVVSVRGTGQTSVTWWLQAVVTRTGAATLQGFGTDFTGNSVSGAGPTISSPGISTATAITISVVGTGLGVANDVVFLGSTVEIMP